MKTVDLTISICGMLYAIGSSSWDDGRTKTDRQLISLYGRTYGYLGHVLEGQE